MSDTFAGIDLKKIVPEPKTTFSKIKCECGNEQTCYSAISSKVNCLVCGKPLAESTGSKTKSLGKKEEKPILAPVVEQTENTEAAEKENTETKKEEQA